MCSSCQRGSHRQGLRCEPVVLSSVMELWAGLCTGEGLGWQCCARELQSTTGQRHSSAGDLEKFAAQETESSSQTCCFTHQTKVTHWNTAAERAAGPGVVLLPLVNPTTLPGAAHPLAGRLWTVQIITRRKRDATYKQAMYSKRNGFFSWLRTVTKGLHHAFQLG